MKPEQFLTEVCNLAACYLSSQNLPNLTTIIANIEVEKMKLVEVLQQIELEKTTKKSNAKK